MALPPTVDLAQRDTVRLISTGRLKPPALRALAADDAALRDPAALEGVTSGRLMGQESGLPDLDPRELVFGRPGHSFINAAFTYTRPGGNRFNDENRGAWYCGFDTATAIGEVAYHLGRELEAVGRFDNVTDYAELVADLFGGFHDLRGSGRDEPALHADPAVGYPAGQALARQLRSAAFSNGIVYPSIRHPGGTCLVAFRPDLVQNLRQGAVWRLQWQGSATPTATRMA
jgi:RES domain-containing protein